MAWLSVRHLGPFLLLVLCLPPAWTYSKTYVMEEYCGDLIDMEYRGLTSVQVKLTERKEYRPHMSCTFGVRAPPGERLILVVQWLHVAVGRFDLCSDFLSVWNGDFANRTSYVAGLPTKICGNRPPAAVTSSGRAVILHFDSNTLEHGAGFFIVFTAFHQGQCSDEEYGCDNGRCIDHRLKCDAHNNCGDFSDNCLVTVGDVVIAVVVTSIIFALVVGALVLYCHRDKLKGRKKCPIIGANPDGVYQPTTEPVTATTTQATTAV